MLLKLSVTLFRKLQEIGIYGNCKKIKGSENSNLPLKSQTESKFLHTFSKSSISYIQEYSRSPLRFHVK